MWGTLCLALVAVQLAYTHAGGHEPSMSETILEMLLKNLPMRGKDGGDDKEMPKGKAAMEHYLEEHHINAHHTALEDFIEHYIERAQERIDFYKMQISKDLITKSIIKEMMSEEEVPEFAVKLMLKKVMDGVEPADESKKAMAMLFDYIMDHPDSEKKETILTLLKNTVKMLSSKDQGVVRAMLLHKMMRAKEDQKEVLMYLFNAMMTEEDLGAEEMEAKDMYLLLIQHLKAGMRTDPTKKALTMLLLNLMGDRIDPAGMMTLRKIVTHIIIDGQKPKPSPEDDMWKFMGVGPCRVQNDRGEEVFSHDCGHDLACDVGPVTHELGDNEYTFHMCHTPPEAVDAFLYHACEVKWSDDLIERIPSCPDGVCDFGPFTINAGEDYTIETKFCSSLTNYSVDYSEIDPLWITACAIEDPVSHLRTMQRKCPSDMTCDGKPFSLMYGEWPVNAYVCHPKYEEDHDLAMMIKNAMLGYRMDDEEEDDDDDDEEEEEESSMMGGADVLDMMKEHEEEEDFMDFVTKLLVELLQEGHHEPEDKWEHHYSDFETIKYLVDAKEDAGGALSIFPSIIDTKHELGIMRERDWTFMDGVITSLIQEWLDNHPDALMGDSESEEDKHMEEHKEIRGSLKQLFDMIKKGAGGMDEGVDEGYDEGVDEGMGGDNEIARQLLKMLMDRLSNQD